MQNKETQTIFYFCKKCGKTSSIEIVPGSVVRPATDFCKECDNKEYSFERTIELLDTIMNPDLYKGRA